MTKCCVIQHTTVVHTLKHIWAFELIETYRNVQGLTNFYLPEVQILKEKKIENFIKRYTFVWCQTIWFVNITSTVITLFQCRAENWYLKTPSKVCKLIRTLLDHTKSQCFSVPYRWNRGDFRFPRRLSLCLSVCLSVRLSVHSVSVHCQYTRCPSTRFSELFSVVLLDMDLKCGMWIRLDIIQIKLSFITLDLLLHELLPFAEI